MKHSRMQATQEFYRIFKLTVFRTLSRLARFMDLDPDLERQKYAWKFKFFAWRAGPECLRLLLELGNPLNVPFVILKIQCFFAVKCLVLLVIKSLGLNRDLVSDRFHESEFENKCCGSGTFWVLIRILLFSSLTLETLTKKQFFFSKFSAYYFLRVHLHLFSKIKNLQNSRNQGFSY